MEIDLAGFGSAIVYQFEINPGIQKGFFTNGTFQSVKIKFCLGKGFRRG